MDEGQVNKIAERVIEVKKVFRKLEKSLDIFEEIIPRLMFRFREDLNAEDTATLQRLLNEDKAQLEQVRQCRNKLEGALVLSPEDAITIIGQCLEDIQAVHPDTIAIEVKQWLDKKDPAFDR